MNLALGDVLEERYGRTAPGTWRRRWLRAAGVRPAGALELLHLGVERAGHTGRFQYGLDCAATHFYDPADDSYRVAGRPTGTS